MAQLVQTCPETHADAAVGASRPLHACARVAAELRRRSHDAWFPVNAVRAKMIKALRVRF